MSSHSHATPPYAVPRCEIGSLGFGPNLHLNYYWFSHLNLGNCLGKNQLVKLSFPLSVPDRSPPIGFIFRREPSFYCLRLQRENVDLMYAWNWWLCALWCSIAASQGHASTLKGAGKARYLRTVNYSLIYRYLATYTAVARIRVMFRGHFQPSSHNFDHLCAVQL
jgi:hypothetical protein